MTRGKLNRSQGSALCQSILKLSTSPQQSDHSAYRTLPACRKHSALRYFVRFTKALRRSLRAFLIPGVNFYLVASALTPIYQLSRVSDLCVFLETATTRCVTCLPSSSAIGGVSDGWLP